MHAITLVSFTEIKGEYIIRVNFNCKSNAFYIIRRMYENRSSNSYQFIHATYMSKYRCNEETLKFNLKVEGNFFESKSIRICTLEECRGKKNQRILYIKFRREEEFMGKLNSLI